MEHLLIGEYEHSIDTKGRLIMPSKLKEDIGEKFVITQGLDGCLFVYSRKRMEKLRRKIKNKLSGDVTLAYLKLHETENSYGEWFAEDQA